MRWKTRRKVLKRRIKNLERAERRAKNPEWKKLWRDIINQLIRKENRTWMKLRLETSEAI